MLCAVRALLRCATEEEVVGIVIEVVRDLGAGLAPPSGRGGELPIDVTFGVGAPLVPVGPEMVLNVVEELLPGLAEDARVVLEGIRRETYFVDSASTDVLTGLPNRRVAMRVLGRLRRGDSVAMLDLDHFKEVNDTLGHAAGDEVLRVFARALRMATRASDTAGRIGGEEFLLLLPSSSADDAIAVLERLRLAWAEIRPVPITFSAGVATVNDGDRREVLTHADTALYLAKNSGRDRFEVAP